MIVFADRRNLQAKRHCSTPPIWALWQCGKTQSSLQCRHIKTHLELAKMHSKDPQTVRNNMIWSDVPQLLASYSKGTSSAHLLQSTSPKVKCAGSSLMLWSCFSVTGTEGLRVEEKLNAPKYRESLKENPVQTIQNLRWAEGLPSNRTVTLKTQREWLIDNSVNVLEWPSQSLNPVKYF